MSTEAQARITISRLLEEAGWQFVGNRGLADAGNEIPAARGREL